MKDVALDFSVPSVKLIQNHLDLFSLGGAGCGASQIDLRPAHGTEVPTDQIRVYHEKGSYREELSPEELLHRLHGADRGSIEDV